MTMLPLVGLWLIIDCKMNDREWPWMRIATQALGGYFTSKSVFGQHFSTQSIWLSKIIAWKVTNVDACYQRQKCIGNTLVFGNINISRYSKAFLRFMSSNRSGMVEIDVSVAHGYPRSLILAPIESAYAASVIVLFCTVSEMLHFWCSWPHPYSTQILRAFPLHQIAHVGVSPSIDLKLLSHEIIFEVFQPTVCDHGIPERHGQTDGQTTYCRI